MSEPQTNIIETALAAGRELAIETQYENGTPFIVAPADFEIHELDHLRDAPIRIEQTTRHTTAQSFIDYYNHYAHSDSAIFIDDKTNTFTAIIDFHEQNAIAGWKKHKATFEFSKTPEWDAWLSHDKKQMTQEDFGRFIENNLLEIIEPNGATMLEIALSIQAKTEVKFSRATRLDNGQLQLAYSETIEGAAGIKGEIKIPEKFTIGLKLFKGGIAYQIDARLRYRIKEGNLALWYELIRPQAVIDANISDTKSLIEEAVTAGEIYTGVSS